MIDNQHILEICSYAKLIPVLVIDEVSSAVPLAQALMRGGLNVLEVTLRTANALQAIHEISQLDDVVVGAGTILKPEDIEFVKQAGAVFGVTPGTTSALLDSAIEQQFSLIPGVATVSEAMKVNERGYSFMKFFPAESAGGVNALTSFAGPLPGIRFCPTGGITIDNAPSYFELDNVICVGGSWVAPKKLVNCGHWDRIETLARQAKNAFEKHG